MEHVVHVSSWDCANIAHIGDLRQLQTAILPKDT